MSDQNLDPRTKKTKDAILQKFKEMMIEMDLSQITIKKLTDRVGINRKTFYYHYDNIEDLILHLQNHLVSTSIECYKNSIDSKDFQTYFNDSFHFWAKEADFVYEFLSRTDLRDIYDEFCMKELISTDFEKNWPNLNYPEIVQAYAFGAFNYLFAYWYSNGKPIPLDEFAEFGTNLIVNGLKSSIKDDSDFLKHK